MSNLEMFIIIIVLFVIVFIHSTNKLTRYAENMGKIEYIVYEDGVYCLKGYGIKNYDERYLLAMAVGIKHIKGLDALRVVIEPTWEEVSFIDRLKLSNGMVGMNIKKTVKKIDLIELKEYKGKVGYCMEYGKKLIELGDKKLAYDERLSEVIGAENAIAVLRYNTIENSRDVIEKYEVVKVAV